MPSVTAASPASHRRRTAACARSLQLGEPAYMSHICGTRPSGKYSYAPAPSFMALGRQFMYTTPPYTCARAFRDERRACGACSAT